MTKLTRLWRWAYPQGGHSDTFEGLGPDADMAARAKQHGIRVQMFIEYEPPALPSLTQDEVMQRGIDINYDMDWREETGEGQLPHSK